MEIPKAVKIVEVGPRDGLQNETIILNTNDKLRLVSSLIDSGVSNIEVTSFVHPKLVPQLADAEILLKNILCIKGINYSALVPNLKGFERALNTNLGEITVFISASESHNRNNVNRSISESLENLKAVCKKAKESRIKVRGEISVSFGCPFEGKVPLKSVITIAKNLIEMSCYEIVLADTIGLANPEQVYSIFKLFKEKWKNLSFAAHFHDTNKMALANVVAAIAAGVSVFDSSIGGLGGCPFAPGATGNVATENLVYMMDKMNIDTGIDIRKLLKSVKMVEKLFKRNIELIPELKKIEES